MRSCLVLLASTALTACGGAGVQTAGSSAPTGSGVTGSSATTTPASTHTFANPTETKTYSAIGGVHSFKYTTNNIDGNPSTPAIDPSSVQYNQVYAGDASTARNSGISVTYNPRDAIFDVVINQPLAGVDNTIRFQDPAHRTNFGGAVSPQGGVPNLVQAGSNQLPGINYLQVGTSSGTPIFNPAESTTFPVGEFGYSQNGSTFFYQRPGTTTRYVTFAGYVRNSLSIAQINPPNNGTPYLENNFVLERGAFTFGERTANSSVPRVGSGTFNGTMLASLVFNNLIDQNAGTPTYFQWMSGTSRATVDFAANSLSLALAGTVMAPLFDTYTSRVFTLQSGATFTANGTARVDLVTAGGFLGQFQSAYFTQPDSTRLNLNIAGSSIDGAFFGPAAEEIGGGFRIVGGTPDERIDILGAFTGAK